MNRRALAFVGALALLAAGLLTLAADRAEAVVNQDTGLSRGPVRG